MKGLEDGLEGMRNSCTSSFLGARALSPVPAASGPLASEVCAPVTPWAEARTGGCC
jgi:hypothetical protein